MQGETGVIPRIILKVSGGPTDDLCGPAKGGLMRCAHCGSADVIEIEMRVGDGNLAFRRCGKCETQGWIRDDDVIDLTEVLDLARR